MECKFDTSSRLIVHFDGLPTDLWAHEWLHR